MAEDLFRASIWSWIAFWVIWLVWGLVTTRQRPVVTRRQWGFGPRGWLLVIAALYFRRYFPSNLLSPALWPSHLAAVAAGFIIELLGLALAVWARYHLGSFWSGAAVLREGHRVVDTGPYRLVRHPIYSGILLGIVGTFLMAGETILLVVLAGVAAGFWWKIRAEERLLTTELGDEYVKYRQRTRRLIPWLL